MSAKILSAGDYIASRCSKCKDSTNHTIVAMVGEKVVKVECNTCGSVHVHRGEKEKKPASSRTSSTTAKPRAATKTQREWQELLEDARPEDATPYSMKTPMKDGMLILHPTFGLGQIVGTIKPNKMEVRFQSGVKLLRCTLS